MRKDVLFDVAAALALFAGSVAYLASLPHNLGFADEAYFLFEAKRIRDGEMLYRDIFQFITPIAPHVMAALYWLFGTTMTTARTSMAVIHGITVVVLYSSARTLRVSAPLAAVAGLAHIAISQPTWPFASWHWFSTCAGAVVLLLLVRGHWSSSMRRLLGLGACCGVLIGIQQQRGLIPTTGIGLLVLLNAFIMTRRLALAVRSAAIFSAGVLLVIIPVLAIFIVGAGAETMYYALVRFPIESYRESFRTTWGSVSPFSLVYSADSFPTLLRVSPFALAIPFVTWAVQAVRGASVPDARRCACLLVFAAACCASVWYYPDFIHIAFIAGPLFVGAALSVQWLFEMAPLPSIGARVLSWLFAVLAAGVLMQHLGTISAAKWQRYPYAHETAFGRVDFASQWESAFVDVVRQRLGQTAAHELFCYPALSAPYLTTGAKNPTPFQYFNASVFPAAQADHVLELLRQRRVPYVVASLFGLAKTDPIAQLIERDYQMVWLPELAGAWPAPSLFLYERKPGS